MSQNDSPKDHDVLARILEKSTADPERIRRVMQDYDAYIERFNNLRDSRAWRKFTELDEDMGRGSGYWSSIYAKNEALHFHRLLIGLDFLGTDLKTFAASVSWTPPLNPPTSGYLFGFRDRTVKESVPDGLESLLEWGQNVAFEPSAPTFPLDAEGAIRLSHSHLAAALKLVQGNIDALVSVRPVALPPQTGEGICKMLAFWADCLRNQGKRASAARVFDLVFALENKLDLPLLRAFTYRLGAYLLSDWGYLDESLEFVQRSERLCLWEGDVAGLGRSLFIKGTLISMRGNHQAAIKSFQASLAFLGEDDWHFALAIRIEIALSWLEIGDVEAAEQALGESAPAHLNAITQAHLLSVRGEIASRQGTLDEAEKFFEQADDAFREHASVQDRLILGLKRTRHYSRWHQPQDVIALAEKLVELANSSPESNRVSRAVVLDLLRNALAGELSLETINAAIAELQSPPALRLH